MKISILIPAYNNQLLLNRCLDSVFHQTNLSDLEIIVSDDNSPNELFLDDKFKKYLSKIDFFWFKQKTNLGVVGNIKFLLDKANFSLVSILQHDDYIKDNDFYHNALQVFDNSHIALYYSNSEVESNNSPDGMFKKNIKIFHMQFANSQIKKNLFEIEGTTFIKLLNKGLNTSWSGIIWRNDYLSKIAKFGSYIPDNEVSKNLDIYNQEEAGAFLYLLGSRYNVIIDTVSQTFRGVPDTRFSNNSNHPGRKNRNDVQFFIFLTLSNFFYKNNQFEIHSLAKEKAKRTGLSYINKYIYNYLLNNKYSIIFIIQCLFWSYRNHLLIFIKRLPYRLKKYLFIKPLNFFL